MSTSFSTKCDILAEVHSESTWNMDLAEFKHYNDLGLPLAYLISNDLVTVKDEGKEYIEDSWEKLCEMLRVDPSKEYKDSDELLFEAGIDLDDDEEDDENA